MKRLLSAAAPCALLVLAHAAPALAQQPPAEAAAAMNQTEAAVKIREAVQKWPTLGRWAARPARSAFENEETTAAYFAALDANGDGKLDSADQALHRRIAFATVAANAVGLIMAADLDGDGEVSREEAKMWSEYRRRQSAAGGDLGVPLGSAFDAVAQAMCRPTATAVSPTPGRSPSRAHACLSPNSAVGTRPRRSATFLASPGPPTRA